ncbi:MAG: RAMP superfamily CRISPR-associated protein [Flavobacteriales bacterium]
MPGQPIKKFRIRVRTQDGKPRKMSEINKLRSSMLGTFFLFVDVADGKEFVISADSEKQIEALRPKLAGAGFEEIRGGDTTVPASAPPPSKHNPRQGYQQRGAAQAPVQNGKPLPGKPYGFVSIAKELGTSAPVWHDGTSSAGRLSGEVRFELETLTPLLVGWAGEQAGNAQGDWPLPNDLPGAGPIKDGKTVLCPLRAPWGQRPVIIPGDSLKGLLRQELGALLGAPLERVAERSYSYRPNALFASGSNLIARIARIPLDGVKMQALDARTQVRVPVKLELLPADLRYDKRRESNNNYYRFDDGGRANYRGGQGAGEKLNSKRNLHRSLTTEPDEATRTVQVPLTVQEGFLSTVRHLTDLEHGHFSMRHPDVPGTVKGEDARKRILEAAQKDIFQPGDLIWVEWDTQKKCIVSLGWHYYYRWAYTDTVRHAAAAPKLQRHGLFPVGKELECDDEGAPVGLTPVRRLFGYTGDNEGSAGIGKDDHAQLMGRVFINAALELVDGQDDNGRFLQPTFLKELGMPRPSAVEHYIKQPYYPKPRPSDAAPLVTYGDAAGYDAPGELAGRKFYLDRKDAYTGTPWEDHSEVNKKNERSTLALEASKPGRSFRFTVRFSDLDPAEVAALLVALAPHQFKDLLGGNHAEGYCSKLGYARPLGWGSVRMQAKQLLVLDAAGEMPKLNAQADLLAWAKAHYRTTPMQQEWLAIHRCKHPDAADYPRAADRSGEQNIFTFHTNLRTEHSRLRRYRNPNNR